MFRETKNIASSGGIIPSPTLTSCDPGQESFTVWAAMFLSWQWVEIEPNTDKSWGLQGLKSEVPGTPEGLNCSATPLFTLPVIVAIIALSLQSENGASSINRIQRAAVERTIGLLLWIKLITSEKTECFVHNCPASLVGIYYGEAIQDIVKGPLDWNQKSRV